MEIKGLYGQHKVPELEAEVVDLEDSKDTKVGLVESWRIKDSTGSCVMTLWREQAGSVAAGDRIRIENGWCSEYQSQMQVSPGKYGKLEKIQA